MAFTSALLACASDDSPSDDAPDLLAQALDASTATPTSDAGSASTLEIGKACLVDSDCKGAATKCQKEVSVPFAGLSINYPGGYCTTPCKADAVCGTGAACPMASIAALLPALSSCLQRCEAATDCRQGYDCAEVPALALPGFGGAAPTSGPAPKHCLPPLPR
ncbi:MAG: hypothetical protein ABW252_18995 [Polyangiales bacterium]